MPMASRQRRSGQIRRSVFLAHQHDGRAAVDVVVDADAVETLEAALVADRAAFLDGVVGAAVGGLAGLPAFAGGAANRARRSLPQNHGSAQGHWRQKNL